MALVVDAKIGMVMCIGVQHNLLDLVGLSIKQQIQSPASHFIKGVYEKLGHTSCADAHNATAQVCVLGRLNNKALVSGVN